MRGRVPRHAGGYILATTLVMLALLALVAERLAHRVELLREQSSTLAELADGLADAASARARTIYRMSTEPPSPYGFGRFGGAKPILPVDGRPIRQAEGPIVALQDERGLLSLNLPDVPVLRRLLIREGVAEDRIDHLIDTLQDYTDTDSLRRLNGAEAPDYEAAGLPPPRNDWLSSPQELSQIIGWRDDPSLLQRLLPLLSARRDGFYNANSSPRAVLQARFPRAAPEQIDQFLARRTRRPFIATAEARSATGLPFDDDLDVFYPGDLYRLRIRQPGSHVAFEYTVWLTPGANSKRPFWILDARTVAGSGANEEPQDSPPSTIPADEAAPAQGLSP
jgi:hypothetical protein